MRTLEVRGNTEDYRQLFLADVPLIDVRAPIEFQQGAFPSAVNLPLLNDHERHAVGTCYKQHSKQAAITLGHQLVSGELREQRTRAWLEQTNQQPFGYIYCYRGGMRSQLVQQWLKDAGVDYPRVVGGYKALRHFLLNTLDAVSTSPVVIIGGNTGCGKTVLINELANGIDLEGAARHRGSSFGRTLQKQHTQINFENCLAIQMLKKQHAGCSHWVLEDESRIIGSNNLPLNLFTAMQQSPLVVIDDPFDIRLNRLQNEYIDQMRSAFEQTYGEQEGWQQFNDYLHHGLFAIRRRLGLERFQQLTNYLTQALQVQRMTGNSEAHQNWLAPLLQHYYDPMYRYQLEKKSQRIIFHGNYAQVKTFLMSYAPRNGE